MLLTATSTVPDSSQHQSWSDLVTAAGQALTQSDKVSTCAPAELDPDVGLMRVGGRLRSHDLDPDIIHPIILDPKHPITQLIIKDSDESLLHPGPERVFGELRRKYWIVGGRPAMRKTLAPL